MAKSITYGILAGIAFLLGYIGLADYLQRTPEYHRGFWDLIYYDLQLFVLSSEPLKNGGAFPAALQIARFIAPGVAASALVSAITTLLNTKREDFLIRRYREHAIVCGGGTRGALLATRLRESGTKVVLIDLAPSADLTNMCRAAGITLLQGDAASDKSLLRAAIRRASTLYALTPRNLTNTAIVIVAHRLSAHRARPLSCYVSINDRGLRAALSAQYLASPTGPGIELGLFSAAEIGVHILLGQNPSSLGGGSPPRILVAGLDDFGQSLVLELARRWRSRFRLLNERLGLVLVDRDAPMVWQRLIGQYGFLGDVCDVGFISEDPDVITAAPNGRIFEPARAPDRSFISIADGDKALTIGLALLRLCGDRRTHVTVRVETHGAELNQAFRDLPDGLFGNTGSCLSVFASTEAACEPVTIRSGIATEAIARSLHDRYVETCLAQGDSSRTNRALVPWEDLPEEFREANRRQVHHIGQKLAFIGCCLVPNFAGNHAFTFDMQPDEVEQLARAEHVRWASERISAGFVHGLRREGRFHPDLVDWGELSEMARDKDRCFIQALPEILADAGFQIVRLPT